MIRRPGARIASFAILSAAPWTACFEPIGPSCTLEAVAGIAVDLRRESGQSLPVADAVGRALDGEDVVELEPFADQLVGAWERPGTYTVTVDKPGFETWVRTGVRVEAGECHVVPVRLEATLSPES